MKFILFVSLFSAIQRFGGNVILSYFYIPFFVLFSYHHFDNYKINVIEEFSHLNVLECRPFVVYSFSSEG